jgi:hypothetical protein
MRKEGKTKLVGLVEISLGSGKMATALLFDNMRWVLDVSATGIPYEIGSTAIFIENDEGDLAIKRAELLPFGHSSIEKSN